MFLDTIGQLTAEQEFRLLALGKELSKMTAEEVRSLLVEKMIEYMRQETKLKQLMKEQLR